MFDAFCLLRLTHWTWPHKVHLQHRVTQCSPVITTTIIRVFLRLQRGYGRHCLIVELVELFGARLHSYVSAYKNFKEDIDRS